MNLLYAVASCLNIQHLAREEDEKKKMTGLTINAYIYTYTYIYTQLCLRLYLLQSNSLMNRQQVMKPVSLRKISERNYELKANQHTHDIRIYSVNRKYIIKTNLFQQMSARKQQSFVSSETLSFHRTVGVWHHNIKSKFSSYAIFCIR